MALKIQTYTVQELINGGMLEKPLDGNHGGIHPKGSDFTDSGIPFIMASDLVNGEVDTKGCKFISSEQAQKLRKGFSKTGDVLLSHKATIGRTALVEKLDTDFIMLTPQVTYYRVKDYSKLNNRYLKYYFDSRQFQDLFALWAGGGSTRAYLGITGQLKLPIQVPDIQVQEKIAHILGTLDDKIQLNRQTNQTLEAMAQALFKSWFVDFDPVIDNALAAGHEIPPELQARAEARKSLQARAEQRKASLSGDRPEQESGDILPESIRQLFPNRFVLNAQMGWIPEGWEITQIKDVARVVKGKSYKSAELAESKTALVTLKSFNRGGGYRLDGLKEYTGSYKPEQEVFAGDLVIAYTDVTQAADVIGKPAMVVSDSRYEHLVVSLDVAVVRPKLDSLKYFLYGLAQTRQFQDHTHSHSTGTTVLHLSKDAVPDYFFALPDEEVLKIYELMVKQKFESIDLNISSLRTLEKLRDTLLPKLISGELRLPESTSAAPQQETAAA